MGDGIFLVTSKLQLPTTQLCGRLYPQTWRKRHLTQRTLLLLLLLLVFSPWAGLGRDQSSVRRLVWLWYAASRASS